MSIESERHRREMQHWSRLAIQFIGAADSGRYEHITTEVVMQEARGPNVFAFLMQELPRTVWDISKLTDVDRHNLSQQWRHMAQSYDAAQFHVNGNGLALLAAYILHMIDNAHST